MSSRTGSLWRLWGFLTFRTRLFGLRIGQILIPVLLGFFIAWTKSVQYGGIAATIIAYLATLAKFVIVVCFAEWVVRLPFRILYNIWLWLYKPLVVPPKKDNKAKTIVLLVICLLVPAVAWQVDKLWGQILGLAAGVVLSTFAWIFMHETKGGKWKLNQAVWRMPVTEITADGLLMDRDGRRFKIAILKQQARTVSRVSVTADRREGIFLRVFAVLAELFGSSVRIIRWQETLHQEAKGQDETSVLYQSYAEMIEAQEGKVTLTALVYEPKVEHELESRLAEAGFRFWKLNRNEVIAFMRSITCGANFLEAQKDTVTSFRPASLQFGKTILMDETYALGIVLALVKTPEQLQHIEDAAFHCGGKVNSIFVSEPYEKSAFVREGRVSATNIPLIAGKRSQEKEREILEALLDPDQRKYLFTGTVAIEIGGEPKDCEQRLRQLCKMFSSVHIVHKRLTDRAADDGLFAVMPVLPKPKASDILDSLDPLQLANTLFGASLLQDQVLSSFIALSLRPIEGSKLALVQPRCAQIGVAREQGYQTPLWLNLKTDLEAFVLVLGRTGSGKSTCMGEFLLRSAKDFDQFIVVNLALRTEYWQKLAKNLGGKVTFLRPDDDVERFTQKARIALAKSKVVLFEPMLGHPIANEPCLAELLRILNEEHLVQKSSKWVCFAIDEAHFLTNPKDVTEIGPSLQDARRSLDNIIRGARRSKTRIICGTHALSDLQGNLGVVILQNFPNIAFFRGAATRGELQEVLDYSEEVIEEILWLLTGASRDGNYVFVLADGMFIPVYLQLSKEELALSQTDDAMQRGRTPEIGG